MKRLHWLSVLGIGFVLVLAFSQFKLKKTETALVDDPLKIYT